MSVFEGIIYHSVCVDRTNPHRPVLEVEAVVRDGDVDDGPILLPWPDFITMVGRATADRCYPDFRAADRFVDHLGVTHLRFTMWTPGEMIYR